MKPKVQKDAALAREWPLDNGAVSHLSRAHS